MALNYPNHPAPTVENRCNSLLWNCKGEECDYHYEDQYQTECPICGTPRRRCKVYPIDGRDSCKFHGGKTLMGVNHPSYQGKGVSKHLPTQFLATFKDLMSAKTDLVDMNETIALLKLRWMDLAERVYDKDVSLGQWTALRDLMLKYRAAEKAYKRSGGRAPKQLKIMSNTLADMQSIILEGYEREEWAWNQIKDVSLTIDRIANTEIKRRKEAENVITRDQFKTLVGFMVNSIQERVTNKDEKMAVLADFQRVLSA